MQHSKETLNRMHLNHSKENNKKEDIFGVVRSVLEDVIRVVKNMFILSTIPTDLSRVSSNPNYETLNNSNVFPSMCHPL